MKNLGKILFIVTMAVSLLSAFLLIQKSYYNSHVTVEQPKEIIEVQPNPREVTCIRQALWHEARGEGEEGIKAVLSVIVNRVNSGHYPDTFCEVIHQPKQFSYVHERQNKGLSLQPVVTEANQHVYERIDELAVQAAKKEFQPTLPRQVLWYTTIKVQNYWTRTKKVVAKIGNHKFFVKKEVKKDAEPSKT